MRRWMPELCSIARARSPVRGFTSAVEEPAVERLVDRGVLRVSGSDVVRFLQGLVSNDVTLLRPGRVQYVAMLNAQGRFLYDMFLHDARASEAEPTTLLADVESCSLPELLATLRRYKLRAKVDVADVSDQQGVWARFGSPVAPDDAPSPWLVDPRLAALGHRAIFPNSSAPHAMAGCVSSHKYWRLLHGVAEGGFEMPRGDALPLQCNLDGLNAISYEKGCYVGQELTTRTHYRGVVRHRLMPVSITNPNPDAATVLESSTGSTLSTLSGEKAGSLAAACEDRGLAMVRLAVAKADQLLRVGDGPLTATPTRPAWWPASWGNEEG